MIDLRGLAVHEPLGVHDAAAEHLADALMPEADPEDRDLARKGADQLIGDPGILGSSRPRGDDEA